MAQRSNIDEFLKLKPKDFCFMKSIAFDRKICSDAYHHYDIEIVMSKDGDRCHERLRIRFERCFDISIKKIEGMFGLLINILDVSSNQIEGARFRIVEVEEDAFSFYCGGFRANLLDGQDKA